MTAQKYVLILFVSIFSTTLCAQKIEKETRIKAEDAPERALKWLDNNLEGSPKINWYLEITSGRKSYEAKYKKEEKKYSVEFSTDGSVEDIEFIVKWNQLETEVKSMLEAYFEKQYTRYKITKIQVQYTGAESNLAQVLKGDHSADVKTRYEIEYYGKNENEKTLWEGLFTAEGELIEKREIIQRPVDNLNY